MKPVTFLTDLMDDQNRHEEYFGITDDGMVFLKPEYRGSYSYTKEYAQSDNGLSAGSKNAELPKHLAVPDSVNGMLVRSLAPFTFCGNKAIEELTIPKRVTEISECMCRNASNLKRIHNTENIETIGRAAFRSTKLEKANFPSLKTFAGDGAFNACFYLKSAEIGSVASIPAWTFGYCKRLYSVTGGKAVETIGDCAFAKTASLQTLECVTENLESVGNFAFLGTRWTCDWSSLGLPDDAYGKYATEMQINPDDFWKDCAWVECENPLPTLLYQGDSRWANRQIIGGAKTYAYGCLFFSIMHAYCGLHGIATDTVLDLEEIVERVAPDFEFVGEVGYAAGMCEALGMTAETYDNYEAGLQRVYGALADGKYVIVHVPGRPGTKYSASDKKWVMNNLSEIGHTVLLYGVNDRGEFLVADSDGGGDSQLAYSVPYQTFIFPDPRDYLPEITIVSLQPAVTYDRYADIATALTDGAATTENGAVGKYTDEDGLHLVLLDDLTPSASIAINKTCTLHLNGHTIRFGMGNRLDVTATGVVIDGTVPGSAIAKDRVTSSEEKSEFVVYVTGGDLVIRGGTYSVTNFTSTSNPTKNAIPLATSVGEKIELYGCKIIASGLGATGADGGQLDYLTADGCVFDVSSESGRSKGVVTFENSTFKDCVINVKCESPESSSTQVYGIHGTEGKSLTVENCNVTVECIPGTYNSIPAAIYTATNAGTKITIKGGCYKSTEHGLYTAGTITIDGGSFEGCSCGVKIAAGEIKAKNATFRTIKGLGAYSHSGTVTAACEVAGTAAFHKCLFESDYDVTVPAGISAPTSGAVVNLCHSEFGAFESDLSAGEGTTINVGTGVDFDTFSGAGTVTSTGKCYS